MGQVKSEQNRIAYLFLVLMQILWSANMLVAYCSVAFIQPLIFNCLRWTIVSGALFILTYRAIQQHKKTIKAHWKALALQGFLGVSLYPPLVFYALKYTTVINASIISAANPILILLASSLFLGEKATPRRVLGITLSFFGVLWVVLKGNFHSLLHLALNKGDLLQVLAITVWAAYSILLRKAHFSLPPFVFMFVTSAFGALFLIPGLFFDLFQGNFFPITYSNLGMLFYIALGGSLLGFSFWNIGVEKIGATRASIFLNLLPVFGSILAVIFLNENLFAYHLIGGLLVCVGVFIVAV